MTRGFPDDTDARSASRTETNVGILVVDDEPSVRKVLSDLLKARGYRVITADSGEQALQLATRQGFDLSIVDYLLPGMDGIRLMQALREIQPLAPRILLTAKLDLPTVIEAVNLGEISRALQKPVSANALFRCVREVLSIKDRLTKARASQEWKERRHERQAVSECLSGSYLRLALQPLVCSESGRVVAREALLRSTHKQYRSPLTILHGCETHGLIDQLGEVVVACAAEWLERLPSHEMLFINLHPEELGDTQGLCRRMEVLQPQASRVAIEITERQSLDKISGWESTIEAMVGRGFAVAVDDLGAGYNSLSVLAGLQPRYLKTDMSIVRDIDRSPRKQRLVELLSRFAVATDALLVAEGVETAEEAETLRACGAHLLQGFYFGKPELDPDL